MLRLPGFEPAGTFGEKQVRSPTAWMHETARGEPEEFVTDSFMCGDWTMRDTGRDMRDTSKETQPRRAGGQRYPVPMRTS